MAQEEIGIVTSPSVREDPEESPAGNPQFEQGICHRWKGIEIPWIHAGYRVSKRYARSTDDPESRHGTVEGVGVVPEVIVCFPPTIQADGDAAHARIHQAIHHPIVEP
jgi:hypothetical protein